MSGVLEQTMRSIEAKLEALEQDKGALREAIEKKREEIAQIEALLLALEEMEGTRGP